MRSLKLAAVAIVLVALGACTATVQNFSNQPFPSDVEKLSMAEIEATIIETASARDWIVQRESEGHLKATYNPRSHSAEVAIAFDQKKYSIIYVDSANLNYNGTQIHRNYNRWVNNLRQDILRAVSARAALAN
ncbi:hypothetical protein ACTU44_19865 [Thalassospira sp. SM2505]|uniref:Lipoprotein n=1 Tax=Thalassospira profundimaris TaxID=502049 RepID=A0A367WYD1_9PROT|nr:hypothetical protein [Thalassospira profundimaris]RCK45730.1 hypothetical protein TH30_11330 [Thalassospira profundimaris]